MGDQPLEIGPCTDAHAPEAQSNAACIGIIGGADGPTALVVGSGPEEQPRCLLRPTLNRCRMTWNGV